MTINNIVVISDTHAGCKLSLCPPDGVSLDDGGLYKPSVTVSKLYSWWMEFWHEFVPEATRGEPYAVVMNGDAIDGVHHNSTTQISHNLVDQSRIAELLLQPVVTLCEGRYYHIRGTEAHVGVSGVEEERLAQTLGAQPNSEKQFARWDLHIRCGPRLCHITHHIGTTGSMAYESSGPMRELVESLNNAAKWGNEAPDVVVRSHRHRCIVVESPSRNGRAIVAVTPGWQLKTPYVYRIVGGRNATPMIGGIVIRYAHGRLFVDPFVKHITPPEPEVCHAGD